MSLFAQELNRIWRPGIFAALLVSGFAFWLLVGQGPGIAVFPNGSQATFHFELAQEWADRFGASIDDAEMREVRTEARDAEAAFESDLATLGGLSSATFARGRTSMPFRARYSIANMRCSRRGASPMMRSRRISRCASGSLPCLLMSGRMRWTFGFKL